MTLADITTAALIVYCYGAIGGWFGLATAYYLSQIRDPPSKPTTILPFAAIGLAMLLISVNLVAVTDPELSLLGRFVVFTLLLVAEVAAALRAVAYHPTVLHDLKQFLLDKPRFCRYVDDHDHDHEHAD